MGRLKIAGSGKSLQAQNQVRGKLFEDLMAKVLRRYGYQIDRIPSVNYSGMEIDIEGRALATGVPLYAECKAYESEVDSAKLQQFYGKYMAKWRKDSRATGIFIALPGINSHAKGFYRENCEGDAGIIIRLFEEAEVIDAILDTNVVVKPDVIRKNIPETSGSPGDWLLLYTERGSFWIQFVVPPGSGVARCFVPFDQSGRALFDRSTLDFLIELEPTLADFALLELGGSEATRTFTKVDDAEEVVEVQGSSACFEYQFPASPRFLVGRRKVLSEVDEFAANVLARRTSARGILFEAHSGWGKSSTVLASVDRLRQQGHFALAIDSRSASSSQFVLRVVEHVQRSLGSFGEFRYNGMATSPIGGFEAAVDNLIHMGRVMEADGKLLFVFLDQFENLFFLPDALRRIRDLLFRITDARTNVILGFSWKTDLVGLTNDFPYQLRDAISGSSHRLALEKFSEVETSELLERLRQEIKARLRKDLTFFLSEFSQGYPWLLKKLCAHVKSLRAAGVSQADIASSLLNVEELFQQDLKGLSVEEEDALSRIAKLAPIGIQELGEDFNPGTVQSLVDRRLIVRIGAKYDIYWDIFRDYLNGGNIPVQENYIIRMQVGSVSKAVKILLETDRALSVEEYMEQTSLRKHSFHNVSKDMKLLGFTRIEDGKVVLGLARPKEGEVFEEWFASNLRERLRRNRLVSRISEELETVGHLTLSDAGDLLAETNPYISATRQTWREYARIFADWMDTAGLAVLDSRKAVISHARARTKLRVRRVLPSRGRSGLSVPRIQYSPVERAAVRLVEALTTGRRVDWTGFEKSTITKSLLTLEQLGFISRETQAVEVLPKGLEFVEYPGRRGQLFAEGALQIASFRAFLEVLEDHKEAGLTIGELGMAVKEELGADWKPATAEVNAKIMLDWARHLNLAPGAFSLTNRAAAENRKALQQVASGQKLLFSDS